MRVLVVDDEPSVREALERVLRLDVAAAARERLRRAEAAGHGDADMAANYLASWD